MWKWELGDTLHHLKKEVEKDLSEVHVASTSWSPSAELYKIQLCLSQMHSLLLALNAWAARIVNVPVWKVYTMEIRPKGKRINKNTLQR